MLRDWDALPPNMRNESVRKYYDILKVKKRQLGLKRVFDLIVALPVLIMLLPMMLFLAVLIKADSKGPVMYRQLRVTQYGKQFRIFKFRTMKTGSEKSGLQVTMKNDTRITRVGKVLRKYRLDELPQLLNIIQGNMTLVGTRPEVVKYVEQYSQEMLATLLLPAGVTSEASIHFKDESNYLENTEDADITYIQVILPRKMKFNLEAIEKYSFLGDLKTLIRTLRAVIGKEVAPYIDI